MGQHQCHQSQYDAGTTANRSQSVKNISASTGDNSQCPGQDITDEKMQDVEVAEVVVDQPDKKDSLDECTKVVKKYRPPVLRQQSCPNPPRQRKDTTVSSSRSLHSPGSTRAIGPTTLHKMFHRQSSTKVCPDDLGESCNTSGSMSPSPTEIKRTHLFLFSGIMSPAPNKEIPEEDGFLTAMQLYNSLNDGQLSPYKFDPTFMLIIDTRSLEDFQKLHIVTAHHIGVLADEEAIEPLETYTMLILYDHKGLSNTLRDSTLSCIQKRLRRQGFNPFILRGGFDTFHKKHPYLCTWQVAPSGHERQKLIGNYPSIVMENQLYLGRADQATNLQIVKDLNLTHIINVTQENPHSFTHNHIKYLKINAVDDCHADLLTEFPRAIEFIAKALGEGGRLLVHCNLGVSRSSTVLISYLMFTRRWLLRDAYTFLKERRPIVRPNRNFIKQLLQFEEMLFGSKLTDIYQWYSPDSDAE